MLTGYLTINSSGGTQYVGLTGTGTAALNILISPTSLNLGAWSLNTISKYFYVNISNIGSQTLDLDGFTMSGANAGEYMLNNLCSSTLPIGANCNVEVAFRPTAQGVRTASLNIADNATNSPQTVSLSGTGNALHVSEYLLNYGDVTVGTSSSLELTLRNLGTRTISVARFKFLSDSSDYTQTNTCSGGIPARNNCVITVTFTPQTQGLLDSVLSFSTNGTGTQAVTSINLKGIGD